MSKLYPPQIGGTLPAFYEQSILKDYSFENYIVIKIPFIANKTVASSEVTGFSLIIRNVSNGKRIAELRTTSPDDWDFEKGEVVFKITDKDTVLYNKFTPGLHYKMQLAYKKNEIVGYYSSIGVAKYTTQPIISISGLKEGDQNLGLQSYTGIYSQDEQGLDATEKVYSYRFDIYDAYGNLYTTSGDQLHNSIEDVDGATSRDIFILHKDLKDNEFYKIRYTVNTINNATFSSPWYQIVQKTTVDSTLKASLSAELNYDNGYVDIHLIGELDDEGVERQAHGRFVLKRSCNKDNFGEWNTILTFELNGQKPTRRLWKDFTVEHGYIYKYAIQQFNSYGMYSNKILTAPVEVAFEDIFLYDGKRQLKMKYNPKITSFKNTVLETKTNTIGSKYPYTFRNGKVMYKEFPINGLISYFSDEEELFISKDEILLKDETTNLTDANVTSERLFKLKVLEFFNNGEPKLFRSPTEGNYIVKLINVSMTPTDQLSRMLHSITGTAYEIADYTYNNLADMKFITVNNVSDNAFIRWVTVKVNKNEIAANNEVIKPGHDLIHYFRIDGVAPGTLFKIIEGRDIENPVKIAVGATGGYELHSEVGISSLKFIDDVNTDGTVSYQYEDTLSNTFDRIKSVELLTYPAIQWMSPEANILERFNTVDTELLKILYMNFTKKEVYTIYKVKDYDGNGEEINRYFWDKDLGHELTKDERNLYYTYKVIPVTKKESTNTYEYGKVFSYESQNGQGEFVSDSEYSTTIEILYKGDTVPVEIDIGDIGYYELKTLEGIESIKLSSGVFANGGVYLKKYYYKLIYGNDTSITTISKEIELPAGERYGDLNKDGDLNKKDVEEGDISQDINKDGEKNQQDIVALQEILQTLKSDNDYAKYARDLTKNWNFIGKRHEKYFEGYRWHTYIDAPLLNGEESQLNVTPTNDNFQFIPLINKIEVLAKKIPVTDLTLTISYMVLASSDNYYNAVEEYKEWLYLEREEYDNQYFTELKTRKETMDTYYNEFKEALEANLIAESLILGDGE